MKKVIVIGGGIAGLSAGIYAQKCGFNTTILESHYIPGGNCTSWKRGGYLFEGGMHWLTGSGENQPLHKLWRHVGALTDNVKIHYSEPYLEYDHEGTPIRLYRDVNQTEKHLIELSPTDEKEIKKLCNYIRKIKKLSMPVTDLRGVKVTKKNRMPLSFLFSAMSVFRAIGKVSKISQEAYINRFKHEGIKEMLRSNTSVEGGFLPLVFTMGTLAGGDGGFPEGGSLPFAKRMADTFTSLGGEILYKRQPARLFHLA